MSRLRVMAAFGTRPEAIKMAPVIKALKARSDEFETVTCITAQHRELLDQVLQIFSITPDFDLNLMRSGQTLYDTTTGVLAGMRDIYSVWKPDVVLVHGDTTTTMAASLAAYYERIPIGHVEAGLRTGNIYSPWPEEMNRKITACIAAYHFAPTETNRRNLLAENVPDDRIWVTGNTVIDALLATIELIGRDKTLKNEFERRFSFLNPERRLILVTAHRRENFGTGMENIFTALRRIVDAHDDVEVIYPVHPNPNVRDPAYRMLGDHDHIYLIDPADYLSFCYLLRRAHMVLTDSGGLQEEAPSIGKPVLVLRDTTERPEAVDAGTVLLVATDPDRIVGEAHALLSDKTHYDRMAQRQNPYGDGKAALRIAEVLSARLQK